MPLPATAPGRASSGLVGVSLMGVLLTLVAPAEHGEVSDVGAEAVVVAQPFSSGVEHCGVNRDHPVTIPADQVEVLVVA